MAKTVEKTRKQIAKKKGGNLNSLHQNSRDSKRLHKAAVRDTRLEKLAETRRKKDKPLIARVSFFQQFVQQQENHPLPLEAIQVKIHEFVHQYDEEYAEERSIRRPGRPASTREDLLRLKVVTLEKEYRDGFYMPDLTSEENLKLLNRWEGSWSFLPNLTWVKVSATGDVKAAKFPPSE